MSDTKETPSVITDVELLTVNKGEQETHSKVLLIFVHGAFTANDRYKPLFYAIQGACLKKGVEVDIGYGSYDHDIPTPARTKEILSALLNQTSSTKYNAKYLSGHSMGALLSMDEAYSSTYDGVIQIGCNFQSIPEPKSSSLVSYPKPVLTLLGEVDGFLKYFSVMEDVEQLDREKDCRVVGTKNTLDLEKPIIVMKNVNHMQAADGIVGEMILNTHRHDFESELSLEDAHERIAETIASFVVITTLRLSKSLLRRNGKELEIFRQACKEQIEQINFTREMLKPFQILLDKTLIREHAREMQICIANVNESIAIIPNIHGTKHDFLYSKPMSLNTYPDGKSELHIHILAQGGIQWHKDLPKSVSQYSPTYAFKAKTQASLLSFYTQKGGPCSIMELNQKTFDRVWNEFVTEEERVKYEEKGRKLEFGEDILVESAPVWVDTPLHVTHSETVTIVQSPFIETSEDESLPKKFRGMFYAKPMTAGQIYEWIVYDAFRKIPSL